MRQLDYVKGVNWNVFREILETEINSHGQEMRNNNNYFSRHVPSVTSGTRFGYNFQGIVQVVFSKFIFRRLA